MGQYMPQILWQKVMQWTHTSFYSGHPGISSNHTKLILMATNKYRFNQFRETMLVMYSVPTPKKLSLELL